MTLFEYSVRPTLARTTISAITTINSMSVKPEDVRHRTIALPVTIFGPVESRAAALRVHVKDVLPAPRRRVRLVLIRTQPPLHAVRHRIDRDAPQVLQLCSAGVVGARHAFDERLEVRRISLVIRLQLGRRNLPGVDAVLELVDRGANLAQVPAQ